MFSHPAPEPTPQQPSDARVPGDPAREQWWARLTAEWRPRPRVGSPLAWAWLRSAWEALDDWRPPLETRPGPARDDGGAAGEPPADPAESLAPELRLLDGALALQQAFDAATRDAAGDAAEDGEPLLATDLGAQIARELIRRQGRTRLFAELWSVSHPEELAGDPWSEQPRQLDPQGEDPTYPLSGDDIAWIVSGSSVPHKHRTWLWTERFEG